MNFIMRRKCRNPRFTRKFSSGSRVGAFGIHQTFIQKSSKNVQKTRSDFALFFYWFFIQKTSQNHPKNPPKNHPKIHRKIYTCFDPFFIDFEIQNGSKIAPKTLPKTSSKKTTKKQPKNDARGVWDLGRADAPPLVTPLLIASRRPCKLH